MKSISRWLLWCVLAVPVLLLVGEVAARVAGLTDVPTYQVDPGIGYIATPNQSGAFLRRHDWVYNDRSMPVSQPWSLRPQRPNVLLIGGGLIAGGNPYRQADKLAPLLQQQLGAGLSIWPAANSGWSAINDIVYLERNPDVVAGCDFFVWQFLRGGVGQLAPWRGKLEQPRQRSRSALLYALRRYVLPRLRRGSMGSEMPPVVAAPAENLARLDAVVAGLAQATQRAVPGVFMLFPDRPELEAARGGAEWFPDRQALQAIADRHGVRVIDVARDPRWKADLYADGTSPTVQGNRVLATILTEALQLRGTTPP